MPTVQKTAPATGYGMSRTLRIALALQMLAMASSGYSYPVPGAQKVPGGTEVLNVHLVDSVSELRALTDTGLQIYNRVRHP